MLTDYNSGMDVDMGMGGGGGARIEGAYLLRHGDQLVELLFREGHEVHFLEPIVRVVAHCTDCHGQDVFS